MVNWQCLKDGATLQYECEECDLDMETYQSVVRKLLLVHHVEVEDGQKI